MSTQAWSYPGSWDCCTQVIELSDGVHVPWSRSIRTLPAVVWSTCDNKIASLQLSVAIGTLMSMYRWGQSDRRVFAHKVTGLVVSWSLILYTYNRIKAITIPDCPCPSDQWSRQDNCLPSPQHYMIINRITGPLQYGTLCTMYRSGIATDRRVFGIIQRQYRLGRDPGSRFCACNLNSATTITDRPGSFCDHRIRQDTAQPSLWSTRPQYGFRNNHLRIRDTQYKAVSGLGEPSRTVVAVSFNNGPAVGVGWQTHTMIICSQIDRIIGHYPPLKSNFHVVPVSGPGFRCNLYLEWKKLRVSLLETIIEAVAATKPRLLAY